MKKITGIRIDANAVDQNRWWTAIGSKLVKVGKHKNYYDRKTGERLFTVVEIKGLFKYFVEWYYTKKFIRNPHYVEFEF